MWMEVFGMGYSDRIVLDYLTSLAVQDEMFTIHYAAIAAATGINHWTVQRAIPRLVRAGFISCQRPGRGYPHTYKVNHEHSDGLGSRAG